MKKELLGIALLGMMISCYSPEQNCKKFKTGTFEFESYLEGKLVKTTFVRNDSIEVDYFKNQADSSSIRWVNDCEYILTSLNPKNKDEEKPLQMRILTTKGDSYTFEYSVVDSDKKQKGTAIKIK